MDKSKIDAAIWKSNSKKQQSPTKAYISRLEGVRQKKESLQQAGFLGKSVQWIFRLT